MNKVKCTHHALYAIRDVARTFVKKDKTRGMTPNTFPEIKILSSKPFGISSPLTIPTIAQALGGSDDGRTNTKYVINTYL